MTHTINDPKGSCDTCGLDSQACAGSSVAPKPANGINVPDWTGFNNGIGTVNLPKGQYYVGQYLDFLKGQTLPTFRVRHEKYPMIARLLFDFDEVTNTKSTKPSTILTFKNLKGMEVMPALDGKQFLRSEYKKEFPNVYIARDENSTNELLLGDVNGDPLDLNSADLRYKSLFEPGDTIMIYANGGETDDPDCCSRMEQRTIIEVSSEVWAGPNGSKTYVKIILENTPTTNADLEAIDVKGFNASPNSIRPELDTNGIVYAGDKIMKLFNGRNDCDIITASYQENPYYFKHSFIQHISFKHEVRKDELNRSYGNETGIIGYLERKMQGLSEQMVDQMASALYTGRNRDPQNSVSYTRADGTTATLPGETMGILPGLFDAHYKNPQLGLIQSAQNLMTDEDKVRLILNQLLQVQMSGAINRGSVVTMLMDSKAISKFMQMNNAWNKFTGFMVTNTDNVHKNFTLPVIQTPYGPTEIMTDYKFEQIMGNSGNILFIPRDLIKITQRENDYYNIQSGGIEKATSGFKFEDVTLPGQHECRTYDIRTEFSFVIGLIDSGAWRMITALR